MHPICVFARLKLNITSSISQARCFTNSPFLPLAARLSLVVLRQLLLVATPALAPAAIVIRTAAGEVGLRPAGTTDFDVFEAAEVVKRNLAFPAPAAAILVIARVPTILKTRVPSVRLHITAYHHLYIE